MRSVKPWTIVREADPNDSDSERWIASIRNDGIEVARVEVYGHDTPSHGLARLIAATPVLNAALDRLLLCAWGLFNRHGGHLPQDVAAGFSAAARAAHEALDVVDGTTSTVHLAARFAAIEGGIR
jgi:hypothetical protein